MTENEKRAREALDKAIELVISIESARNIFAEKPDIKNGKTAWPVLTEEECFDVSVNYPFSLKQIRKAFAWT